MRHLRVRRPVLLLAALCVGLGLLLPWAFRWVENGEQVLLLLAEFPRIGKAAYAAAGSDTVVEVLLN